MPIRSLSKEIISLHRFKVDSIEGYCFGIINELVPDRCYSPFAANVAKLKNTETKGESDSSYIFRYGACQFF